MKQIIKRYIAEGGLLLVGILWGLGFVFVKIGLNEGISPFYLLTIRFLGSFLLLYLAFMKRIKKFSKYDIKAGIIIGIFQFLGYGFQTFGAELTTAGKNAFFTAINVVIVPYIFWIIHKKRPDIFAFVASIFCLLGVGVMSFDRNFNLTHLNLGDILTIISAIFFAAQIVSTGYFSKKVDPLKLILLQMLVAGIFFGLNLLNPEQAKQIIVLKGITLVSVIYLTVFSTAVTTLLQTYCQKQTTSTRASILLSTESLFAPLFAYFLIGEVMSKRTIIGAGMILFAVILSETKLGLIREE